MMPGNIQFKALLARIVIGAVAGIVVYIIALSLGMPAAASGGIIGGIVGAVGVALIRREQSHRTN
jgi:phosphate/sulfate permease